MSYPTAVVATRGQLLTVSDYFSQSRTQMSQLAHMYGTQTDVLEFGCGIGGNLIAISDSIRSGAGVDINKGYLRIANRLRDRSGIRNLRFGLTDSLQSGSLGSFDFAFSVGVFERMTQAQVHTALRTISSCLKPTARVGLYFLTERALRSKFAARLGKSAYVTWSRSQITETLTTAGFRDFDFTYWSPPHGDDDPVADMVVATKHP